MSSLMEEVLDTQRFINDSHWLQLFGLCANCQVKI
jgi:hypothetical protein